MLLVVISPCVTRTWFLRYESLTMFAAAGRIAKRLIPRPNQITRLRTMTVVLYNLGHRAEAKEIFGVLHHQGHPRHNSDCFACGAPVVLVALSTEMLASPETVRRHKPVAGEGEAVGAGDIIALARPGRQYLLLWSAYCRARSWANLSANFSLIGPDSVPWAAERFNLVLKGHTPDKSAGARRKGGRK